MERQALVCSLALIEWAYRGLATLRGFKHRFAIRQDGADVQRGVSIFEQLCQVCFGYDLYRVVMVAFRPLKMAKLGWHVFIIYREKLSMTAVRPPDVIYFFFRYTFGQPLMISSITYPSDSAAIMKAP